MFFHKRPHGGHHANLNEASTKSHGKRANSLMSLPSCLALSVVVLLIFEGAYIALRERAASGIVQGEARKDYKSLEAKYSWEASTRSQIDSSVQTRVAPAADPSVSLLQWPAILERLKPVKSKIISNTTSRYPLPPDCSDLFLSAEKDLYAWSTSHIQIPDNLLKRWAKVESRLLAISEFAAKNADPPQIPKHYANDTAMPSPAPLVLLKTSELPKEAVNRVVCVDFYKDGPYGKPVPELKWEPFSVPNPEVLEWRLENYKPPPSCHINRVERQDPCVWGEGASHARVMERSYFLIKTAGSHVRCYARATGAGIILVDFTVLDDYLLRGEFTPLQDGEYKLWISCSSIDNSSRRIWPPEASVPPWFHNNLLPTGPSNLTVVPNDQAPFRGCSPCDGAKAGSLKGQWVRSRILRCLCGKSLVGMEEWFDDEYVWTPRECILPFRRRKDFLHRFGSLSVAIVGGASMRGYFVNLANWLKAVGPNVLQQMEGYVYDEKTGVSSWDGDVAGFQTHPFEQDSEIVLPNPLRMGKFKLTYIAANSLDDVRQAVTYAATGGLEPGTANESTPSIRGFDVLLLDWTIWHPPPDRMRQAPPLMYDIEDRMLEDFKDLVEQLLCMGNRADCVKPFAGRLILTGATGSFNDENYCGRQRPGEPFSMGKACSANSAAKLVMRRHFRVGRNRNFLYLDAFPVAFSRPDRSIDGNIFFPRKCSPGELLCGPKQKALMKDCCWPANSFPHTVGLTLTNLFVNMLWDDNDLLDLNQVRVKQAKHKG